MRLEECSMDVRLQECLDYYQYMRDGVNGYLLEKEVGYCETAKYKIWPEVSAGHFIQEEAERRRDGATNSLVRHLKNDHTEAIFKWGVLIVAVCALATAVVLPSLEHSDTSALKMILYGLFGFVAGMYVGCMLVVPVLLNYWKYYYKKMARIIATIVAFERLYDVSPLKPSDFLNKIKWG